MNQPLLEKILSQLQQHDDYFVQKNDGRGVLGLSDIQKITAAMRMLAYGLHVDCVDEYVNIAKRTAIEAFKKFYRGVVHIFEAECLRFSNEVEAARLLHEGSQRGLSRMLGSLDYMH